MRRKTINTNNGATLERVSNWINVDFIHVAARNSLAMYADNDGWLCAFKYRGKYYALEQFTRCGSYWMPVFYQWEEADGLHFISGIQNNDYYTPLFAEVDDGGEAVRLYREVLRDE